MSFTYDPTSGSYVEDAPSPATSSASATGNFVYDPSSGSYVENDPAVPVSSPAPAVQAAPAAAPKQSVASKVLGILGGLTSGKFANGITQAIVTNPTVDRLTGGSGNYDPNNIAGQDANVNNILTKDAQAATKSGNATKANSILSQVKPADVANALQSAVTDGQGYQTPKQTLAAAGQTVLSLLGGSELPGTNAAEYEALGKIAPYAAGAARIGYGAANGALNGALTTVQNGGNLQAALSSAKGGAEYGGGISGAIEGLPLIASKVAGVALPNLFGLTTGAGKDAIEQAFANPSQDLIDAMRGKTDPTEALTSVRNAVQDVVDNQKAQYAQTLEKMNGTPITVDTAPIAQNAQSALAKLKITGPLNDLDFSSSPISDVAEQKKIQGAANDISTWKDNSFSGVDTLKQRLDNVWSPSLSPRAQNAVTGLKNSVRDELQNQVPGYNDLKAPYAHSQALLDKLNSAFSLKSGNEDASLAKVNRALNGKSPYKQALLQTLQQSSPTDIQGVVAGNALNSVTPNGLAGKVLAGLESSGGSIAAVLNPHVALPLLATLPAYSPRAVGEAAVKAGQINNLLKSAGVVGNPALRSAIQRIASQYAGQQNATYPSSQ